MQRREFIVGSLAAGAIRSGQGAETAGRIVIGQIGTTHAHASGKMGAMRGLGDLYEVAGVVENDEAQRERMAKSDTYKGLKWLSEEELLATPGLKAVAVEGAVENATPSALRCIRAGKHVHLDKPGGLDHAAFKAMRTEAEEKGLTVQMGYMLRYNPAFELLFRAVREGWLGEIREIDAMMGKLASDETRQYLKQLPGGGMFELACHVIDAAMTLAGKPKAVHAFNTPSGAPEDKTRDNQLAVLEYPKATVTIRCNHVDPFGGPRRRFLVAGTRGTMEIQPLESGKFTLYLSEAREGYKKGEQQAQVTVPKGRYTGEFQDLAKVIRGEKKLAWDAAHDVAVHETVMRAAGMWRD